MKYKFFSEKNLIVEEYDGEVQYEAKTLRACAKCYKDKCFHMTRHYNNEGYNNDEILNKEKIVKTKLLMKKQFHMKQESIDYYSKIRRSFR